MSKQTKQLSKRAIPGFSLLPRDGYYQVRKIGLTAERVKKDPAFKKTRRLAQEFATVIKLSKSIGEALLSRTGVKKMAPTLTSAIMKAVQIDSTNLPGYRRLHNGQWQALEGLDLNQQALLNDICRVRVACQYNRQAREIKLQVPPMIPAIQMDRPPTATHYRIMTTIINIDARYKVTSNAWQQSTLIPVKHITVPPVYKIVKINSEEEGLHLVLLFIQWYGRLPKEDKLGWNRIPGPLKIVQVYNT